MSSPLSYLPFFHRDWLSSSGVRKLSFTARAVYIDLLCYQWEDGFIPNNHAVLIRLCNLDENTFNDVWEELKNHFVENGVDGQLINPRLDDERQKVEMKCQLNRENGKKGGRPKTETKPNGYPNGFDSLNRSDNRMGNRTGNPNHNRNVTQTKPNLKLEKVSISNEIDNDLVNFSKLTDTPKEKTIHPRWQEFKDAYPKRAGNQRWQEAYSSFTARLKEKVEVQGLIDGAKRYAAYIEATGKTRTEFVMCASTFLSPKQRGWEETWDLPALPVKTFTPISKKESFDDVSARVKAQLREGGKN